MSARSRMVSRASTAEPSPASAPGHTGLTMPLVCVGAGSLCLLAADVLISVLVSPARQMFFRGGVWIVFAAATGILLRATVRRRNRGIVREAAALTQCQEHYRLIADNATDVIWTLDLDSKPTYVSPSVERLRGYTPAEVLRLPLDKVVCPSSSDALRTHFRSLLARGYDGGPDVPIITEVEQPCKNGSTVWVEMLLRLMRDTAGNPVGILGVSRNISQRRLAETALRQSEERFRTVFDVTPMGIAIIDPLCRVVDANPAYSRITGYTLAELRQLPDSLALLHPDERDACRAHFASVADGEQNRTPPSEWRIVRPDGSTVWARHVGAAVHTAGGQLAYAVAVVEDITQAKLTEERLRQAHKMEAIGQLAGGVAHDFNNLLQVILGCTDEVLTGVPPLDPRHPPLAQVQRAARHAADLTRQLLAFSRRQMLHPVPLDLRDVVSSVMGMLARLLGPQIDLDVQPGPDTCPVLADRSQMEQVVLNLCLNARDAMPAGGRLTVSTGTVELSDELCSDYGCARPGRYATIRVVDTGVGMDEDTLARVFEPFFTTKPSGQGTGLGLCAVFGTVSQHGGAVTATSKPGQGSAFTVLIPSAPVDAVRPRPASPAAKPPGGLETILVAEDEELLRDLACRVLQRAGYKVLTATDGDQAVELAERHRGAIDLLLLDLIMPGRSGPQAYKSIVAGQGQALPCVLVSGRPDDPSGLALAALPGIILLPKPYERDELLRVVRQTLDAATGR